MTLALAGQQPTPADQTVLQAYRELICPDLHSASSRVHASARVQLQVCSLCLWCLARVCCGAADKQARVGSLRAQLGALEQEKAGEFESQVKGLQDLSAALQAEQQSRLVAQLELNRQKKRVTGLEAEVQQQRVAMTQVG